MFSVEVRRIEGFHELRSTQLKRDFGALDIQAAKRLLEWQGMDITVG